MATTDFTLELSVHTRDWRAVLTLAALQMISGEWDTLLPGFTLLAALTAVAMCVMPSTSSGAERSR